QKKVNTITINYNGDGFTNDNYESFCTYRSAKKKSVGAKGVGRFVFLKVYEKVNYVSKLAATKEDKSFVFDFNFDSDNIKIKTDKSINRNSTEINFLTLTDQYYNLEKHIDKRIDLDLNKIRENVLLTLIPTLFFF